MINNTTLRAIALGAALGFVIAVVPSCGGTKPASTKCNHNTCPGCCDDSGNCFSGVSPGACGVDGITCLVCKTGQSCAVGSCRNGAGGGTGGSGGATGGGTGGATGGGTGGATGGGTGGATGGGTGGSGGSGGGAAACSNVNCPNGCCDPINGSCRVGDAAMACGAGGLACKVCNTMLGQMCTNNACTGGQCDATTCPTGCCSNATTCVTPQSANQCGSNGTTCQTCQGANPQCNIDAGVCLGGAGGSGGAGGAGGGFGVGGGFGGAGGSLCNPACMAGECCDIIICVAAGAMCPSSLFIPPTKTCNATTLTCQ